MNYRGFAQTGYPHIVFSPELLGPELLSIYLDLTQVAERIAKTRGHLDGGAGPRSVYFSIRPVYLRGEYSHLMAQVRDANWASVPPHTIFPCCPNAVENSRPC